MSLRAATFAGSTAASASNDGERLPLPRQRIGGALQRGQHVGDIAVRDRQIAPEDRVRRVRRHSAASERRPRARAARARRPGRRRSDSSDSPAGCRASSATRRAGGSWRRHPARSLRPPRSPPARGGGVPGRRRCRRWPTAGRRPSSSSAASSRPRSAATAPLPGAVESAGRCSSSRLRRACARASFVSPVADRISLSRWQASASSRRSAGCVVHRSDRIVGRDRLPVAGQRPRGVAEVWIERTSLDVADLQVRGRELAPEVGAIAGVPRQLVEVFQPLGHEQLPRRRGTGQVADGVVDVEQRHVRQLPHVVEALLGARPFAAGDARLPRGGDDAGDERDQHQRRRRRPPVRLRRTNFAAR